MNQRYAKFDKAGRVQFAVFDSETDAKNVGYLPYEETGKPTTPDNIIPHNYTRTYEEKDGKIVLVWKAYPNYEAIAELKRKLESTDYKVIKCQEISLIGGDMPYDVNVLHAERQEIRDEINRLEECK